MDRWPKTEPASQSHAEGRVEIPMVISPQSNQQTSPSNPNAADLESILSEINGEVRQVPQLFGVSLFRNLRDHYLRDRSILTYGVTIWVDCLELLVYSKRPLWDNTNWTFQ